MGMRTVYTCDRCGASIEYDGNGVFFEYRKPMSKVKRLVYSFAGSRFRWNKKDKSFLCKKCDEEFEEWMREPSRKEA